LIKSSNLFIPFVLFLLSTLFICSFISSEVVANPNLNSNPNLKRQQKWTKKEKDNFINGIQRNRGATYQDKDITLFEKTDQNKLFGNHAGKYLSLSYHLGRYTSLAGDNFGYNSYTNGPLLLWGDHLFSWVRFALGAQYSKIRIKLKEYDYASFDKVSVPTFIELALIPLGSPHTRYLIFRGGVIGDYVWGSKAAKEAMNFNNESNLNILGLTGSWYSLAGYEWQLGENFWRIHVAMDLQVPFKVKPDERYINIGMNVGVSYVY